MALAAIRRVKQKTKRLDRAVANLQSMVSPVIVVATRSIRRDIVDKVNNNMIKQGENYNVFK